MLCHFPEIIRVTKNAVRHTQSRIMATQTPIAPHPICTHRIQEPRMRKAIIDPIPTSMVKRTSLAARKAFGRTKDADHKATAQLS